MKKIILSLVAVAISYLIVYSQPCLPEGIIFSTQSQINNFQNNYPGCTEIDGNVQISGLYNITNLNGLSVLTSIGGNLVIQESFALTGLTGLDNLTSIGGGIWIESNYTLASLTGLENLTSMGGNLFIFYNSLLEDLTALDNLQSSTIGNLYIVYNSILSGCNAQSLCYYLVSPNGTVEIHDNAPGCNSQLEIEETCDIQNCLPEGITFTTQEEIDNFQANYPGCMEIEGDVTIIGIDITNLEELSVLTSVEGTLNLWHNPVLINLSGLENLTSVGGLRIDRCDALTSLIGLESLTSISGDIEINSNNSLANLIGLEGLTSIPGNLIIKGYIATGGYYNSLKSLEGLENIESIGGYLMVNGTDSLTTMHGLEGLNLIGGSLIIGFIGMPNTLGENIALTSLEGLGNINTIGEDLNIEANTVLNNLTGLEGLTTIGGSLLINYNDSLTDLNGLEGLVAINGGLTIGHNNTNWGNPILTDISGLENIEPGTIGWLDIEGNDSLSDCSISNLCNYLASPNAYVYILNNAPGCNNPEEVEEHCLTTIEEQEIENGLNIIPNPSKDKITISSPANTGNTQLSIFNVNGEKVLERQLTDTKTQLDISALPRGVYFVRVQDEKMVEVGKMVKE